MSEIRSRGKWSEYKFLTPEQKKAHMEDCKAYEKTQKGFIMRMYRNMKSRISGVQTQKSHLYEGKEILSKEDFYDWVLNNSLFQNLFEEYKQSGFDRKLAPSIDRIDPSIGYVVGNMRLITHSQNSAITSNTKSVKINGVEFESMKDAHRTTRIPYHIIQRAQRTGELSEKHGLLSFEEIK